MKLAQTHSGEPAGGEERFTEEYLARALERAQNLARQKGFIRTALPPWIRGVSDAKDGSLIGTSEALALDLSVHVGDEETATSDTLADPDAAPMQPRGGIAPQGDDDDARESDDPQGDLHALERARIRARTKWVRTPGMAAMHLQYRSAGRIDSVLATMVRANKWDTPTKMGSIMAKWPQIVGPDIAEHSTVEAFEEHTLIVRCSSTAWAKQLHLLLQMIERRIDEEVGAGVVERVLIRGPVAPSWRKGPLSVKGRGPRDTYG